MHLGDLLFVLGKGVVEHKTHPKFTRKDIAIVPGQWRILVKGFGFPIKAAS